VGRTLTRWLIPLPAIILSFWPTIVRADPIPGLATNYYTIDEIPPVQSVDEYPLCGSEVENNINRSYDGEPYGNCTGDLFMVHMTGYITIPVHNTIEFWLASDDGGEITIDGNTFGVWLDQGCSATVSGELDLDAGSLPLELWMYENGGGTCIMLAWNINGQGWEMVPDSAFTTQAGSTTTTTTTTSTSTTSTTLQESTTTSSTTTSTTSTSTTTLPQETTTTTSTTLAPTTTQTTTTTSTTTIPVQTTTTTSAPYTPPQTTTTSEPVVVLVPDTTTTTVAPEPESTTSTTIEETSTTEPVEPDPTVPESVPTLPAETTTPTSQPLQEPDTQETLPPEVESSSTTTLPDIESEVFTEEELDEFVETLDIVEDEPITDEKVEQILEVLADAAPAQIVAAIEQILTTTITSDQAVSIASTPEVLSAVTEQQAEAIFEEIIVEELTTEQADELVEVLNEAPTKVKKAFQETIDVFSGLFDSFQMVGQTIPVGERRTLVAVSNTLVAVGASLRRRNT
jgi:hypothetical protein